MESSTVDALPQEAWAAAAAAHEERIDRYVAPHLARRAAGLQHPVFDFLFTYYSFRPAQLRRWTPGFGVDPDVTPEHVASQRPLVEALHRLLSATARRAGSFGCFGLHEWA